LNVLETVGFIISWLALSKMEFALNLLSPEADICSALPYVCFGPKADIAPSHSITSSARLSSDAGTFIPSVRAV